MEIIEALKIRKYFIIAAVSSSIFASVYIYAQVLGIIQNIDLWFATIPHLNLIFFIVFVALFGMTLSFQIYRRKQPKTCGINKKAVGAESVAAFGGFFVAQCPACASIGALLLPSSIFLSVFVKYGLIINIVNIALLIFTIRHLGEFKKTTHQNNPVLQNGKV